MMRRAAIRAFALGLIALAVGAGSAGAATPLRLGIVDGVFGTGSAAERAAWLERAAQARASILRLSVHWRAVTTAKPPAFPANPSDPSYRFGALDRVVKDATARGFEVMLTVAGAPDWALGANLPPDAELGTWRPDPIAYAAFARAVATRYSGLYRPPAGLLAPPNPALPRVRYYQAWNEPNLSDLLAPQSQGGAAVGVEIYRSLLNGFYDQVKAVSPDNVVVTAGTAPFGDDVGGDRIRPLEFWRALLCVGGAAPLNPTGCPEPARFDIFAHHPINTVGGPHDSAAHRDDVTVPDMGRLRQVLRTAERLGTVAGFTRHPIWVTELWWETDPPDPSGISLERQARWIAESLYELWRQKVDAVFYLGLADAPYSGKPGRRELQSGLFFAGGEPKPSYTAYRFPLVTARARKKRLLVWTIAPVDGKVKFQRLRAGTWKTVARRRGGAGRVVRVKLRAPRRSTFRARAGGESSLPYSLREK